MAYRAVESPKVFRNRLDKYIGNALGSNLDHCLCPQVPPSLVCCCATESLTTPSFQCADKIGWRKQKDRLILTQICGTTSSRLLWYSHLQPSQRDLKLQRVQRKATSRIKSMAIHKRLKRLGLLSSEKNSRENKSTWSNVWYRLIRRFSFSCLIL